MGWRHGWDTAKTHKFQRSLLKWYRRHHRKLPWRDNPTPYRVWISEIMLQQTQVQTVIPYYNRFLNRFPDIKSLAEAEEGEVLALWAGLGYYSRARNLHRAARLMIERRGGFPEKYEEVLALPGIGPYTAGAICSLAFNQPRPVVDGNIRRVITRLKGITKYSAKSLFWDQMSAWIPDAKSSFFNQAMMELGATICMPFHPRCRQCPVEGFCEARRLGMENKIPAVQRRQETRRIRIAILVLQHEGRLLVTDGHMPDFIPGRWGFPCQQIQEGKSPKDVASIMCRKMLGRKIPLAASPKISHSITRYRIEGYGFFGRLDDSGKTLQKAGALRWVDIGRLGSLLISSLFKKAVQKLPCPGID
ncbi:MAG: A/G-specific adenine glycosylase [Acidobacteria bacterium]|nr:A/G-specific adenine glycosylase [Acidobacteriota bacterium]